METRFSVSVQTGPGTNPASCTMGYGTFPGIKSGRGVTLSPHPLLVPRSCKSRAIPLPPYGPNGLYRSSVPVQGCTLRYLFTNICCVNGGPGCVVGRATDYGLDGLGSNPGGYEIYRPSTPAFGPTQPPVQWVPGLSRG